MLTLYLLPKKPEILLTKHRGAGRQQECVSCCQQPHHLSLEAHCRMASTWALELARLTWKSISLTHRWVNSGWAPHTIWGSVSNWPLCYWGVEMMCLPSYGVIKMCECSHGQFKWQLLSYKYTFVLLLSSLLLSTLDFSLHAAVGLLVHRGACKKADPQGQCLTWFICGSCFYTGEAYSCGCCCSLETHNETWSCWGS